MFFTLAELEAAVPVVRAVVPPTPQFAWPLLKARFGAELLVKHENHTPTGAFKVRGGLMARSAPSSCSPTTRSATETPPLRA